MESRQQSPLSLSNFFTWWYRHTTLRPPSSSASFLERDRARRSNIASTIILMTIAIMLFFLLPPGIIQMVFTGRPVLLIIATSMLVVCFLLTLLNRRGLTSIVGIVLILGNTIGNCISLTTGGVIHLSSIQLLDSLVISLLFAVSLLPAWCVFVNALANVLIAAALLRYFPHDTALGSVLPSLFPTLVSRSAVIQIGVAIIAYLLVRVMQQSIERANNAEELATLERAIALQKQAEAEQKQRLDEAIQDIIRTHVEVANGNFHARASLSGDNVLWSVAGNLNNLLSRMQQWRRDVWEREQLKNALSYATTKIVQARRQGIPVKFSRTGTELDALLIEFNYYQQEQRPLRKAYLRPDSQQPPRMRQDEMQRLTPIPSVKKE